MSEHMVMFLFQCSLIQWPAYICGYTQLFFQMFLFGEKKKIKNICSSHVDLQKLQLVHYKQILGFQLHQLS